MFPNIPSTGCNLDNIFVWNPDVWCPLFSVYGQLCRCVFWEHKWVYTKIWGNSTLPLYSFSHLKFVHHWILRIIYSEVINSLVLKVYKMKLSHQPAVAKFHRLTLHVWKMLNQDVYASFFSSSEVTSIES